MCSIRDTQLHRELHYFARCHTFVAAARSGVPLNLISISMLRVYIQRHAESWRHRTTSIINTLSLTVISSAHETCSHLTHSNKYPVVGNRILLSRIAMRFRFAPRLKFIFHCNSNGNHFFLSLSHPKKRFRKYPSWLNKLTLICLSDNSRRIAPHMICNVTNNRINPIRCSCSSAPVSFNRSVVSLAKTHLKYWQVENQS